ncbi:DUF4236 domain-containing protein [Pseudomonas argentinensis]|uniref:DUF4236 domain-containing protein n=1 Tax=Phytopseudomonas argentinensis TaxID=289370 RepID=A0A1I3NSF4_9GAMM|nr:DUF4236 domain-containing protein [Pseudomonas argentinensis]SFJ12203.1 Protein of unknown function [Pseudomonas argentinensis]
MALRIRKSIKIAPGIRLNVGKKGVSTSVGGKGFTVNIGKKGTRLTTGIPGSGISASHLFKSKQASARGQLNAQGIHRPHTDWKGWQIALVLASTFVVLLLLTRS